MTGKGNCLNSPNAEYPYGARGMEDHLRGMTYQGRDWHLCPGPNVSRSLQGGEAETEVTSEDPDPCRPLIACMLALGADLGRDRNKHE